LLSALFKKFSIDPAMFNISPIINDYSKLSSPFCLSLTKLTHLSDSSHFYKSKQQLENVLIAINSFLQFPSDRVVLAQHPEPSPDCSTPGLGRVCPSNFDDTGLTKLHKSLRILKQYCMLDKKQIS